VREALEVLKVDPIDHGVRCEADRDLVGFYDDELR
jgi:adenosine deaminase